MYAFVASDVVGGGGCIEKAYVCVYEGGFYSPNEWLAAVGDGCLLRHGHGHIWEGRRGQHQTGGMRRQLMVCMEIRRFHSEGETWEWVPPGMGAWAWPSWSVKREGRGGRVGRGPCGGESGGMVSSWKKSEGIVTRDLQQPSGARLQATVLFDEYQAGAIPLVEWKRGDGPAGGWHAATGDGFSVRRG